MIRYTRISQTILVIMLISAAAAWCAGTPYGANGLGTYMEDNTGRSRGMGGSGAASLDGLSLLRSNPALLSTFDRPFYGIGMLYTRSSTATGKSGTLTFARTDPSLIRFVLPMGGKVFFGWGVAPFTRADAKMEIPVQPGDTFTDTMTSSGGVNVTSFELAAKYKMISAGTALNYYFGSAQEEWRRDFHGAENVNNSTDYLRKQYGGYGATVGILARLPRDTSVGIGYTTPTSMDVSIHVRPGNSTNTELLQEKVKADLPGNWRLGVASRLSRQFSVSADFTRAEWSKAARTDKEKRMYNDTYTFGAGVRYIPSTSPTAKYLSTIPLSAGFRMGSLYYKSYPKVDAVREAALTFGVEFPFMNGAGGLITSWEIGKRGDKAKNGWDETFFNIGISLAGGIK
ncbi:MAG: outer membrane protein transport protein [Candidatus Latescibacterota bacterium]